MKCNECNGEIKPVICFCDVSVFVMYLLCNVDAEIMTLGIITDVNVVPYQELTPDPHPQVFTPPGG